LERNEFLRGMVSGLKRGVRLMKVVLDDDHQGELIVKLSKVLMDCQTKGEYEGVKELLERVEQNKVTMSDLELIDSI